MNVHSLQIRNFRNIESMEFYPDRGVNVIFGENAQGKTNLLEAIWLFSGLRSFRASRDRELIRFGQEQARLSMNFSNDIRDLDAVLTIGEKKTAELGGVALESAARLCGEFQTVIFSPGHLELIRGGPAERRSFMNQALCQLKPNYAARLTKFNRILRQRNILLKDLTYHSELMDTLEIWDDRFAKFAAYLTLEREAYLNELRPPLQDFYSGISGEREQIAVQYESGIPLNTTEYADRKEEFRQALSAHRRDDLLAGFSTIGPHRDELAVTLNGIPIKAFGSQGQQRSSALSLKMAEAAVIQAHTNRQPVVLLDDVMSELDIHRQDYILNHIEGWQVFITCCEPSDILKSKSESGKMFEVKDGKLCSSI